MGITYCDGGFPNCHFINFLLFDKSLQMDLYKDYDLPALQPDLKVQLSYVLEGQYLAILMPGMYATMPTPHNIHLCLASQGHFCVLNTAQWTR